MQTATQEVTRQDRHFASKDELVAEAYQLALDHLFEMIEHVSPKNVNRLDCAPSK